MRVDLDETEDQDYLTFYHGEPFTGEAVEKNIDGSLATLYTYRMGTLHGPFREWFPDSRPSIEAEMDMGSLVGTYRRWHRNGVLAEERYYSEPGRSAGRREWDQDGRLIADIAPSSRPDPGGADRT